VAVASLLSTGALVQPEKPVLYAVMNLDAADDDESRLSQYCSETFARSGDGTSPSQAAIRSSRIRWRWFLR
jgi:hypothetical protein